MSRQIVRSLSPETQLAIHDSRNCGWVHVGRCHQMAEGGTGRIRGLLYLIKYVGRENMVAFVQDMGRHLMDVREFMNDIQRAIELMEDIFDETDRLSSSRC